MSDSVDKGNLYFVLGGARSGKSSFASGLAEQEADAIGLRPLYVATASQSYAVSGAGEECAPDYEIDKEMAARIAAHKAERGSGWDTIEEPLEIARLIEDAAVPGVLMVDCLTLWITNLIGQGLGDEVIIERAEAFATAASKAARPVIVVSNEVGQGLVPVSELGRRFRDLSGIVNQRVAAIAKDVYFVTAGIPHLIKG